MTAATTAETFGGITIPSVFRAAWHESEFFRAEITGAVFS
jgi:hypothetical protein